MQPWNSVLVCGRMSLMIDVMSTCQQDSGRVSIPAQGIDMMSHGSIVNHMECHEGGSEYPAGRGGGKWVGNGATCSVAGQACSFHEGS